MRDDCPQTATPPDCLDDNLVAGFVEGVLGTADRGRVERLIDQCVACRRQVSEVMRVRSTVGSAQEREPDRHVYGAGGVSPALDATAASGARPPERIGRYEVRGTLGQGGMGVVLRAWDPQLEREVAVKLVRGSSADGALRLVREARAMARLRHPAVITVHDAGIVAGEVFVVMELVAGENLADWFGTRPAWTDALARCRIAGAGLAAAHAAGLVHRDFKPHNVLCDRDGRVLVADFGLARGSPGVADAASALTSAGAVVGTPAYMAPEQHLGEAVGPAADQFAFAATLYEGLYGVRPFTSTTLAALISEVLSGNPRPPPATSDVPRAIGAVVLRGLARDPADRWPSIQAMLDALEAPARARVTRRALPLAAISAGMVGVAVITWAAVGRDHPSAAPAPTADAAPAAIPAAPVAAGLLPDLPADRRARWDVLGELATIDAFARSWAPDAALAAIIANRVRPDGTTDIVSDFVQYLYASPVRAASADPAINGTCRHAFHWTSGLLLPFDWNGWDCADLPPVGPPRCTIAQIWKRASADGADPSRVAALQYRSGWGFQQGAIAKHYEDDCVDPLTRWDPLADRGPIDARALAWEPDAVLQSLVTVGVRPDGTADLTAGAFVQYSYLSPRRAASDDLRVAGMCLQTLYYKDGVLSQWDAGSSYCPELRVPGPPRCTFVEIWRRAVVDGADPTKPADIRFEPTEGGATWTFTRRTFGKQYSDDC